MEQDNPPIGKLTVLMLSLSLFLSVGILGLRQLVMDGIRDELTRKQEPISSKTIKGPQGIDSAMKRMINNPTLIESP